MSPNSDNAMARFLFAILKQKNLKDIDWNEVARDPVLLQPIANGHAARMRYSRFRATVTGQEPQRRARHAEKSRVTKPNKGPQSSKGVVVKSESGFSLSSYAQFSPASTCVGDTRDDLTTRFLTPCSDDMAQTLPVHPAAVETGDLYSANVFAPATHGSPGFLDHVIHPPAPDAFNAAYELGRYGAECADLESQDLADTGAAQPLTDCGQAWNDRFDDQALF